MPSGVKPMPLSLTAKCNSLAAPFATPRRTSPASVNFNALLSRFSRLWPPTLRPKSRYALLPARKEVITSEHVRKLMEQEGI